MYARVAAAGSMAPEAPLAAAGGGAIWSCASSRNAIIRRRYPSAAADAQLHSKRRLVRHLHARSGHALAAQVVGDRLSLLGLGREDDDLRDLGMVGHQLRHVVEGAT